MPGRKKKIAFPEKCKHLALAYSLADARAKAPPTDPPASPCSPNAALYTHGIGRVKYTKQKDSILSVVYCFPL